MFNELFRYTSTAITKISPKEIEENGCPVIIFQNLDTLPNMYGESFMEINKEASRIFLVSIAKFAL
jgi:hypothetical protein